MSKTAMQELIESIEGNMNAFPDQPQFKGLKSAFKNAILLATELLEKEKEQIKDAYFSGAGHYNSRVSCHPDNGDIQMSEDYYDLTYTKPLNNG